MAQTWHDLLFAHWPIAVGKIRPLIPPALKIDTHDGQGWIGVVPFRMTGVRPRGLPPIPWISAFPEINLRTYVELNGKPGVYFFSLDAANPLAVWLARKWFRLPYFYAEMSLTIDRDNIRYASRRRRKTDPPAEFKGGYRPVGGVFQARPGSLEHWLIERYCLYAADFRGTIFCSDIHHAPWPLQLAEMECEINTMANPHGISLGINPRLIHFAKKQDVLVWPPTPCPA